MDLSLLPELGRFAPKLAEAGVADVESLASWPDIADLAQRTGVSAERLESFRDAARDRIGLALAQAGVGDEGALTSADLDEVARATGIARHHLELYRASARGETAAQPAERLPDKVLLLETPHARVQVDGRVFAVVPLVTARAHEDAAAIAERVDGPFVLLKETAATAYVRVDGQTFGAVPLYKEREGREVRIRIAEIREKSDAPSPPQDGTKKRGFLGRSRKK